MVCRGMTDAKFRNSNLIRELKITIEFLFHISMRNFIIFTLECKKNKTLILENNKKYLKDKIYSIYKRKILFV